MDSGTNEKRRFILWNISRNVPSPGRGPHVLQTMATCESRQGFLGRFIAIATTILNSLRANPRKTLVRFCWVVAILLTIVLCVRQGVANATIARAYAEIERAGGERFPNHPSRIVFHDSSLSAEDLRNLLPFLKAIPSGRDVDEKLSPCRALDFTRARNITEAEVASVMKEMENTIVFYYTTSGVGRCERSIDLQNRMAHDRRLRERMAFDRLLDGAQ